MAKVFLPGVDSNIYNPTSTTYMPIMRVIWNSTETSTQITFRAGGTLSNLYCFISANSLSLAGTFKTRVNGADGNQSVSVTAGVTGEFEDTSNTDTVTAGDEINYSFISSGTGTATMKITRTLFDATSNTYSYGFTLLAGTANISGTSATLFRAFIGSGSTSTEANISSEINTDGTLKHLFQRVTANARSSATTFGTRIAGANGNLIISVGSGATGFFEDTSNTDTVTAGQICNLYSTVGTGTGTISVATLTVGFETTNNKFVVGYANSAPATIAANSTASWGANSYQTATSANTRYNVGITCTFSKLWIYISANTVSAASTLVVRKNNVATAVSASITASTTGEFIDSSNSVSFTETNEFNFLITTGVGGTSLTPNSISVLVEYTTPASYTPTPLLFMMAQSGGLL